MIEESSEFGKGFSYCLGLFLGHQERYWGDAKKIPKEILKGDYSLWFNGAADHLYEFDAENAPTNIKDRCIAFKNKALKLRLYPATEKDMEWALREAKDILMAYDRAHGYKVVQGSWE